MKIHSIKFNYIMNMASTAMNCIFPLITFPYVARVLTVDGYGVAEYALATAQLFSFFALLGINLYGTRECSKVRDDKRALSKVTLELLILVLCSTFLTCVLYFFAIIHVPSFRSNATAFFIAGVLIPLTTIGVQWFMNATEQYAFMTVRNLVTKSIIVVLMFALVHSEKDVLAWIAISVAANGAANIANFAYMRQHVCKISLRSLDIKRHIRPMILFFLVASSIGIYTSLDSVMLGLISTDEAVAFYRVPVKIKNLLTAVMAALSGVLVPRTSYMIARGNNEEYERIIGKSIHIALIFGIYASALIAILAQPVIFLLAGEAYSASVGVMQIIAPAILFISLTQITANEILTPLGKEKRLTLSYMLAAVINFSLNLLLIPIAGAFGAAVSTTIAELLVCAVQVFFVSRIMSIRLLMSGSLRAIAPSLGAALVAFLLSSWIGVGYIESCIIVVVSLVFLLAGLLLCREDVVVSMLRQVLRR